MLCETLEFFKAVNCSASMFLSTTTQRPTHPLPERVHCPNKMTGCLQEDSLRDNLEKCKHNRDTYNYPLFCLICDPEI